MIYLGQARHILSSGHTFLGFHKKVIRIVPSKPYIMTPHLIFEGGARIFRIPPDCFSCWLDFSGSSVIFLYRPQILSPLRDVLESEIYFESASYFSWRTIENLVRFLCVGQNFLSPARFFLSSAARFYGIYRQFSRAKEP